MLDIKFLRENPDIVKQNIKNKFQDRKLPLVDEVIAVGQREPCNSAGSGRAACEEKENFQKISAV